MRVDPTLQARLQRGDMQTQAESSHTGQERCCNVAQFFHDTVSSTCAVVGFFVGYAVALPKNTPEICPFCQAQAELSVDWDILPQLCHADNVEARSIQVEDVRETERATTERASGSGSARGPWNPPERRCTQSAARRASATRSLGQTWTMMLEARGLVGVRALIKVL